ncbi:MAG: M1 family metallopeptidase [Cyclobacteriaceae bacterium]
MKYNFIKKGFFPLLFVVTGHFSTAQNYWQQRVEYVMNVDFDVDKHQFSGSQTIKYFNNSPDTLFNVFYHLYFNAFQPESMMDVRSRTIEDPDGRVRDRIQKLNNSQIGYHKISKVKQDGSDLTFKIEGTVLEVDLAKPVPPGTTTVLNLNFDSQVPIQIRRSGRNNAEGIDYSMAQWFPKLAEYDERGWHAHPYVAREFFAPWGDFEVNLTIDKSYVVAATGILQNADEIGYGYADGPGAKGKGKTYTWKFKAENVHDFVWTADPDYKHVIAEVPGGPALHFFYQDTPETKEWENLPELAVKAFQYIEKNFGEYPFPHYSIIQGGDGGMEYPMATLITGHRNLRSLVGVTVHEALHSWYQGLLATNESYFAWMDEGYTSYATSLTMAHVFDTEVDWFSDGNYGGYFALAQSGREEPMSTHSDQYETNFAYGRAAYSKGAVSIAQLGYIIGEETRDKVLLRYFNEWKFKHPDLNDFVRVAEKTSGLELDWYYDYWVNSTKTIDYGVGNVEEFDGNVLVEVIREGTVPMPMDVTVTFKDGSKKIYYAPLSIMRGEKKNESETERVLLPDWKWTHPSYNFQIEGSLENIQSIQIDESGLLADVNRDNNKWTKK